MQPKTKIREITHGEQPTPLNVSGRRVIEMLADALLVMGGSAAIGLGIGQLSHSHSYLGAEIGGILGAIIWTVETLKSGRSFGGFHFR